MEKKGLMQKKYIKRITAAIALMIVSIFALCIDVNYMLSDNNAVAADEAVIIDNTCTINSAEDLVAFSKAYQTSPDTYQKVNIYIAIASGNLSDLNDFVSIGTAEYPFAGNIIAGSTDLNFTLDKPLFSYVMDSVGIKDSGSNTKNLILSRSASADTPLFATNVVHDSNSTAPADWKITASVYKDSDDVEYAYNFSGFIGSLGQYAAVSLELHNDSVTSGGKKSDIFSDDNAGLAVQSMGVGSSLTVSVSGTNTSYNVTSSNGNAGGLVGSMADGSALELIGSFHTDGAVSAKDYAGGLVGRAKNARIILADDYVVEQVVSGELGTGGVFGYYSNTAAYAVISGYTVDSTLNGAASGGLFGELVNSGTMTIDSSNNVTVDRTSIDDTYTKDIGGLIGRYSSAASVTVLNVEGITVNVGKNAAADNYGGVIGSVSDGPYGNNHGYIKFSDVTVNAGGCKDNINSAFGGLVGSSDKAFIDAENVTINTAVGFVGGGVVGKMNSGVLRLSGKTDLSGTEAIFDSKKNSGQIVGIRGQALIYARDGWKLIRGSAVKVDDIGTWGEVLRFNADTLTEDSVLTVDDTAHTVTVAAANTTVSNLSEFAALALNIQLNSGDIGTLLFDSGSTSTALLSASITLTGDIDLTGTGITGLTRDNGENDAFTGTFSGGGHTITLAIGEAYGFRGNDSTSVTSTEAGNGKIYRHNYDGLFAKTGAGAKFSQIVIDGEISVDAIGTSADYYIGGLSALHTVGALSFEFITAEDKIELSGGNKYVIVGGILGRTRDNTTNLSISVKDSIIRSEIICSGNGKFITGGTVGEISTNNFFAMNAENVTVSAKVTNKSSDSGAKAGCLLANISNYSNAYNTGSRTLTLKNIIVDGAEVVSSSANDGSGLLGKAWNNTEVTIGDTTAGSGVTVKNSRVSASGSGSFAAIVTAATGYWKVYDVNVQSITVEGASAQSFGMLINKALYSDYSKTYALYLELQSENAFTIASADLTALNPSAVFDELVATCTGDYYSDICENLNAVVSVHTGGGTVIMNGAECNTYQNRSGRNVTNKYTRYYYDLDVIRGKAAAELTAPEQLMLWSVYNYAYDNIRKYFTNPITSANNSIPAGNYDMTGYSYYPVDVAEAVTIANGSSFVFCNEEIESGESGSGNSDGMVRSTVEQASQHYLMHCGLFRNVTSDLTVNGAAFSGNVGNFGGSGALFCGTSSGSVDSPLSLTVKNVVLNGIKVNDLSSGYAPLLMNNIGSNVKMTISGVSTAKNVYSDTAATSLIGNVGSDDADNIRITFSALSLDGRISAGTYSALDDAYGTQCSVFSKALLLNSFRYQSGKSCSAVYNFKYAEDWNSSGTPLHNVAYGSEISSSTEYPDKQKQYIDSDYYTDPVNAESAAEFDFSAFRPYVAAAYDEARYYHEIKVNHKSTANLDQGCGTYNDPYIINHADQMTLIADLLDGVTPANDGVIINYYPDNHCSWCENKTSHTEYIWNADTGAFADENGNTISVADIQTALSTAYYRLNSDITLSGSFAGLGRTVPFKGVIYGADCTVTNKSTNPFIYQSTGAVIKDLTVNVTAKFTTNTYTANSKYATDETGSTAFYGGLIGIVNGGDNIIDKVSVTFEHADTISVSSGNSWGNVAVGGYIGVLRYGAVIFRNMDGTDHAGIVDNANKDFSATADNDFKGSDGKVRLYLNRIIGRVIDGYAVTETGKYEAAEENVTMKNGAKNYSIADIDINAQRLSFSDFTHPAGKNSISAGTITVPDAQSLFIMGCIAMSGSGSAAINGTYPSGYSYGNGQMTRHAAYDMIGSDDRSDFDAAAKTDAYSNTKATVPYIIYKYTTPAVTAADGTTSVPFPARNMTNNSCVFNIELVSGTYDMPGGFRGIGSLTGTGDELEMYIYGVKGNGSVIDLNTSFCIYNYDYYYKINGFQDFRTGLGLFNSLIQNKSSVTPSGFESDTSDKYFISDLTLTGNITYDVLVNENGAVQNDKSYYSCVGGIAGVSNSCSPQIENVRLSSLDLTARYVTGGVIGSVMSAKVKISGFSADNLSSGGGMWAGGLIGFSKASSLDIDGKNGTFGITEVASRSSTSDYNHCVGTGGLIGGIINKSVISVKNTDIIGGSINSPGKSTFLGGAIGCVGNNNSPDITLEITNVSVNNTDINKDITSSVYTGGLIGTIKKSVSKTVITDCHVTGSTGNIITGYIQSGGLIGLAIGEIAVDGCYVSGYTLRSGSSSETIGGLIAKAESAKTIVVTNSSVSDCILQQGGSQKPVAGIVGHCTVNMQVKGYNILSNNVQITDLSGNSVPGNAYAGDVVGYIQSGSVDFVGVCIQKEETGKYAGKDIGTNNGSSFVIFADYDGKCLEAGANTAAPTFNSDSDVADMGAYPYVTVDPSVKTFGDDIITGDGISSTAITNIVNDIHNSSVKAYRNVTSSEADTFSGYTAKLSDFKEKTNSDRLTDAQNFPVLVINDSNYSRVTEMINSYAHLLTNDTGIANYANADSRYNVDISSFSLSDSGFVKQADSSTLEIRNGYFRMSDTDYDSSHDSQFTLIDIQYYAPNDTDRIAYHLYIPVYVEKMLKFDFKVGALSGTKYNTELYTFGNPVLESYGTPVTAYMSYTYLRTAQEWQDAINGGEDLMKGYGKSVLLSGNYDLPGNTKLVLVDRSNYSKAYYSTIQTAFDTSSKVLDLSRFTTSDGASAFSPVSFCTLLGRYADIAAVPDANGTLVKCGDDISAATIRIGSDYFRKKTDTDADTSALYSVTVTAKAGMTDEAGNLIVREDYYISFFTEADNDQPMRNITISSPSRLGDDGMIPSRLNNAKSEQSNVHMILGNLYDQSFTFETTGDEIINENNNTITGTLKAVVSLKSENADDVKAYLKYRSIHLYHGFVIEAARTDEDGIQKGIKGSPQVTGTYTAGDTVHNISYNVTDPSIILTGNDTAENTADIKQYLINSNSVTITCNDLKIIYADDAGIIEQFPERKSESSTYGVVYSAYSNLAYVQENIGQSNITAAPVTPDGKNYYRENISVVTFTYNIPSDSPNEMVKIGINGREINGEITAVGYYNVLNIPEEDLNKASKLKFTLYLYQKNEDGSYSAVDINEYLSDVKLEGQQGVLIDSGGTSVYDFVFNRDELKFEAGSFEVSSTYSVVTGEEFESASKVYANYKVQLAVQMLDTSGNYIANSGCSDYIIYTNAKIYTDLITEA